MGKPHIIATFYQHHQAEAAFHKLLAFIPREDISIVHRPNVENEEENDSSSDNPLDGILVGGVIGGIGGALAGLTMLAFPGIGILLAAGPIYSALAGATTGGIIGGFMDLGINQYEAEKIEDHLQGGAVILTIEAANPNHYQKIYSLLQEYQADYITDEAIISNSLEANDIV